MKKKRKRRDSDSSSDSEISEISSDELDNSDEEKDSFDEDDLFNELCTQENFNESQDYRGYERKRSSKKKRKLVQKQTLIHEFFTAGKTVNEDTHKFVKATDENTSFFFNKKSKFKFSPLQALAYNPTSKNEDCPLALVLVSKVNRSLGEVMGPKFYTFYDVHNSKLDPDTSRVYCGCGDDVVSRSVEYSVRVVDILFFKKKLPYSSILREKFKYQNVLFCWEYYDKEEDKFLPFNDPELLEHSTKRIQILLSKEINLPRPIQAIDLFCGGGLFSHGMEKSKQINVKLSVDYNESAKLTYQKNNPHTVVRKMDVRELFQEMRTKHAVEKFQNRIFSMTISDAEHEKKYIHNYEIFTQHQISLKKVRIKTTINNDEKLEFEVEERKYIKGDDFDISTNTTEYIKMDLLDQFIKEKEHMWKGIPGIDEKIDLVFGSPPCKDVSTSNRHRSDTSNHKYDDLFFIFLDFVEYLKPKFFLLENVLGMLQFNELLKQFNERVKKIKYTKKVVPICSGHFGSPQLRWRVFIIGENMRIKENGTLRKFVFPAPIHSKKIVIPGFKKQIKDFIRKFNRNGYGIKPCRTLWHAISDLPQFSLSSQGKGDKFSKRKVKCKYPLCYYQYSMQSNDRKTDRHVSNNFEEKTLSVIKKVYKVKKKGANWNDLSQGTRKNESKKSSNYKILEEDKPFPCITGYVHANQSSLVPSVYGKRVFSCREAARGQCIKDEFKFEGSKRDVYLIIGNGVPANFGELFCEIFKEFFNPIFLREEKEKRKKKRVGGKKKKKAPKKKKTKK